MYEIQLFGTMEVRSGRGRLSSKDFGGVKPRQILALLALRGALHKGELADLLWQANPPTNHVATLESYVSVLRRRLDPTAAASRSVVVTRNGGYALNPERVRVDVARFDELISAAVGTSAVAALPRLREAVRLAAKPLLVDEAHVAWAVDARERYRARLVDAAVRAAEHALTVGDAIAAQELAERATVLDPLTERAWKARMSAYRAVGDRAAALRSYDECRRLLADNLGVVPSPEVQQLFLDLLWEDDRTTSVDDAVAAVLAAAAELTVLGDQTPGGPARRVVQLLMRAAELAGPRQPGRPAIVDAAA
jgi:DNA-binding SARP family transcriptional activator